MVGCWLHSGYPDFVIVSCVVEFSSVSTLHYDVIECFHSCCRRSSSFCTVDSGSGPTDLMMTFHRTSESVEHNITSML